MADILLKSIFVAAEASIVAFVTNKLLVKRLHPAFIHVIFIGTQVARRFLASGEVWQGLVLNIVSLVFLLVVCYFRDVMKKVSLFIVYCAITMSCEVVSGIIISMLFGKAHTAEDTVMLYATYALHKVLLFVSAYFFLKVHNSGFSIKGWLKYLPIPLGIFISMLWFYIAHYENNEMLGPLMALGILGFLICIFLIGYVQYKEKQRQTAECLRRTEEHNRRKRHYMEDKRVMLRYMDRLAHDSAHHLECLVSMDSIEAVHEYAERILKLNSHSFQITGNSDIDCILRPKQQRAEDKGIRFHVSGLLPDTMDFLDLYDIVTILGNGLDNAIDACEKIAGGAKFINVSFHFDWHLSIRIDNPFAEAPVAEKSGWFRSNKNEPGHGLGVESIQEAVGRYHGHTDVVIDNGTFSVRILLQQVEPHHMAMDKPAEPISPNLPAPDVYHARTIL